MMMLTTLMVMSTVIVVMKKSRKEKEKNICVFNPSNVTILKVEHIEIYQKNGKNLLVEGSKKEVAL